MNQARIKQREEENMDRKAEKAQDHGEQLRRDRATVLDRIQGYHRHIDGCTAEMSKYFTFSDIKHYDMYN